MLTVGTRSRRLLGAGLALLLLVPVAAPVVAQDTASPAPVLADLATDGGALATRFMEILGLPDADKAAALETFLAPEFQIVRANGDRLDRAAYLASPAAVRVFQLTDVNATQGGDLVVVSYMLATTETVDGVQQTSTAPRLSVFHWSGSDWKLAAHSNFGVISSVPAPTASPPAVPAG